MTISAKIILDSFNAVHGIRLTTMELCYPRFIHAEFMTHRVFSRNASSSRAIPVARQIRMIQEDPAMPIHWGKNQPGMQAHEEHDALVSVPTDTGGCMDVSPMAAWLTARDMAVQMAQAFSDAGYHKQIVNRILEPFSHIRVLVTATDWNNFFALRNHADAQPEIRELAIQMQTEMCASKPQAIKSGNWHLPYINEADEQAAIEHLQKGRITRDMPRRHEIVEVLCAISAARCARVSYLNHEGKATTLEEDMSLYFRLVQANPPHMSPCEHQAQAMENPLYYANFRGWKQFRASIHGNTVHG